MTKVNWEYELGVIDTLKSTYEYMAFSASEQEYAKKNKMFFTLSNGKVKARSYKQIGSDRVALRPM